MRLRALTVALVVSVLGDVTAAPLPADQAGSVPPGEPLEITALASNLNTIGADSTALVEISISRWTPVDQRAEIISLLGKGTNELLTQLRKSPSLGRFRVPGVVGPDPYRLRAGTDVRYAFQTRQANGFRRIVVATERYASEQDVREQPRLAEYPFTVVEIRADAVGDGEGKMAVSSKLTFDKASNTLTLEDYDNVPIRLTRVKVTTLKPLR